MRIERHKQRNWWLPAGCLITGCGCMMMAGIVILLLLPALPGLALNIAGFQAGGSTDSVFQQNPPSRPRVDLTPIPAPAIIEFGTYGQAALPQNQAGYTLGVDSSGTAQLTFTETALMALCHERTPLCSTGNAQIRNANIDLRPGGAVIFADMFIPQLSAWQNLGIVMQLSGSQFQVAGLDIDGTLYQPETPEMTAIAHQIEQEANAILDQLALSAGTDRYALENIYADDTTLTLILR